MKQKILSIIGAGTICLAFNACGSLELDAKLDNSIFIEPVAKKQKTLFLFSKNTSDCMVNLDKKLGEGLKNRGYVLVDDPNDATFILSTNVIECSKKTDEEIRSEALKNVSPGIATLASMQEKGFASSILDSVTGEYYTISLRTDVNIKQRAQGKVSNQNQGEKALNNYSGSVSQKTSSSKSQSYESDFIENQTIVTAKGRKKNLNIEDILPTLETETARKIFNLF